jgi:protein-S-isoprenylcysteine O-methyltransferase Ste14
VAIQNGALTSASKATGILQMVTGLMIPLLFCGLQIELKGIQLARLVLRAPSSNARTVQEIVHVVLSIIFLSLMAFLFLTRKRVISPQPSWCDMIVALAGSLTPFLLVVGEPTHLSNARLLVSVLTLLLGDLLMVWTLGALGRCFGVFPAARGLVTHGPYRFVRHPLYVAEAIAVLGFLVTILSPLTVAIYLGSLALQGWRAANEERVLWQVFPEYADYQQRTGRFLPRLSWS